MGCPVYYWIATITSWLPTLVGFFVYKAHKNKEPFQLETWKRMGNLDSILLISTATPFIPGVWEYCFYWKLIVGIPRTRGLLYSPWQPLGIPSYVTPIGQLHQSPPLPIPGDQARGKRSPRAAARHRSRTRAPTDLQSIFSSVFPILSEIGRLPRVLFAKSEIGLGHTFISDTSSNSKILEVQIVGLVKHKK